MSQEKLKTILMQNCGGQTKCIMGSVEVATESAQLLLLPYLLYFLVHLFIISDRQI